jgi:molybdopterin converting factor small subunit
MAKVKVRSFTVIRDVLGAGLVEVDVACPATVKGVFDALLREYGEALREKICDSSNGELTPFPFRLNDEILSSVLHGDRAVKTGDEITIIFPVGGGC